MNKVLRIATRIQQKFSAGQVEWPQWLQDADTAGAVVTIENGSVVWHDGLWKNGTWEGGEWLGGVWEDGVWEQGVWHDGVWKDGDWVSGEWLGGIWKSSKRRD